MYVRFRYVVLIILLMVPVISSCNTQDQQLQSPTLADDRAFEITWTSRTSQDPSPLSSGDTLIGDDIRIHAIFPDDPNNPEQDVKEIRYSISTGFYLEFNDVLTIPDSGYDPFEGIVDLDQFYTIQIDNIDTHSSVLFNLMADNFEGDIPNCDAMAWWAETDENTWTYDNNILSSQMIGENDNPEIGLLNTGLRSGSIVFAIFNHGPQGGSFSLTADSRGGNYIYWESNEVDIYSRYDAVQNDTYFLEFIGFTEDNTQYVERISDVTILGAFVPKIESISIVGPAQQPTISWVTYDYNADDMHEWTVSVSRINETQFDRIEDGVHHMSLSNLSYVTSLEWNSVQYPFNEYIVRVTIYDQQMHYVFEYSNPFYGGVNVTINISGPENITMYAGQEDTSIVWTPECQMQLDYEIRRENVTITQGEWEEDDIVLLLNETVIGLYEYELILLEPVNQHSLIDIVTVEVLDPDDVLGTTNTSLPTNPSGNTSNETSTTASINPNTDQTDPSPMDLLSILITLSAFSVIAIIGSFTIYSKRSRKESHEFFFGDEDPHSILGIDKNEEDDQ